MAKQTAEQSNRLSIFWLKKHGYLEKGFSYQAGGISWSYGGHDKSSIGFSVNRTDLDTPYERTWLNLKYTNTSSWDGEKTQMDYNVELTTTRCNYGGVRYWFICPLYKSGRYCGKRVGVIYSIGKWFGCRHCGEICYNAQLNGGTFRVSSISDSDIEKAESEVKRKYYKGKPTRKYKRLLRLTEKSIMDWITLAARLGGKYKL